MIRTVALLAALGTGALSLAACEEDGPLEEAGESADEAMEDADEALEDAGEDLDDSTR